MPHYLNCGKKVKENYSFLKDPHLIYFLQSPYKIQQLLKTRRYKLDKDFLIQIDTNTHFKIDPYVMKKLKIHQIQKMLNFNTIIQDLENKDKFQAFRQTRVKLQNMNGKPKNQKVIKNISQNNSLQQFKYSRFKKQKSEGAFQINNDLSNIKGLKDFKNKILR